MYVFVPYSGAHAKREGSATVIIMPGIVDFRASLRELGSSDDLLTAGERRALDEDGFVYLRDIIDARQAEAMRRAMEAVFALDGVTPGCGRDSDFIEDRSAAFDVCLTHPRFLSAIAYVLKEDFTSLGVHSRPNPPGLGHQHLHPDWNGPARAPGEAYACNSIWMLAEFTSENGATRVVPGSHRLPGSISDHVTDLLAPHPDEVHLCGPPGTVAVFNAHVWHSARLNRGSADRANVTSFWRRRQGSCGMLAPALPAAAMERLPPAARFLQVDREIPGSGLG
jgi:hypothetical protein